MRETYSRGFVKRTPVIVDLFITSNQGIKIKINDYEVFFNIIPEKSEKQPLTLEKVITQFSKTGNTPFKIKDLNISLDENLFLPLSTINEVRRKAFEEYENYLKNNISKSIEKKKLENIETYRPNNTSKEVSIFFNILRKEYKSIKNVDNIYFSLKDAINQKELLKEFDTKKYILLPSITKSNYQQLIKKNIVELVKLVDGFVLSNIGQLKYFEGFTTEFVANYTFNTFNTYTIDTLEKLGFKKIILSPELTRNQINSLGGNLKREIIAYGKTCVMTSEYCPIGSIAGGFSKNNKCSMPCIKNDTYYLRDRLNMDFRVIPDNIDCQSRIFNSKITSVETNNLNIDSIRIDVIDENIQEVQHIIDTHKKGKKLSGEKYTNGHINRGV